MKPKPEPEIELEPIQPNLETQLKNLDQEILLHSKTVLRDAAQFLQAAIKQADPNNIEHVTAIANAAEKIFWMHQHAQASADYQKALERKPEPHYQANSYQVNAWNPFTPPPSVEPEKPAPRKYENPTAWNAHP